jgi:hypothetical protein
MKPEVTYEVWQGGEWQAASDSEADAKHYLMQYAQDGPATLYRVETMRTELMTVAACTLSDAPNHLPTDIPTPQPIGEGE